MTEAAREDTIERMERALKLTHKKSLTVTIPRLTAERVVYMLKEQEPKTIRGFADTVEGVVIGNCPRCDRLIVGKENDPAWFCKYCGQAVIWK